MGPGEEDQPMTNSPSLIGTLAMVVLLAAEPARGGTVHTFFVGLGLPVLRRALLQMLMDGIARVLKSGEMKRKN